MDIQLKASKQSLRDIIKGTNINDNYIESLKTTEDDNYDIIILNLSILFKDKSYSASDIIYTILDIEKSGFKFHCQVLHYIFFTKKKSLFRRLFKKSKYKH